MQLAIYGSRRQDFFLDELRDFFDSLAARNIDVVMHTKLYNYLLHIIPGSLAAVRRVTDRPDFTADYVLSIGGDGTFLRTAMWVADKELSIIGINTGHLGYLTAAGAADLPHIVDDIADGVFVSDPRSLIHMQSPDTNTWPYALNDIAITKGDTSSMLTISINLDGVPLADYNADGILIATPTGSTAYNLSVGGPIVQPGAPVNIISPVAAHSLSMRPLVIDSSSVIEATVATRSSHFRVALDGRSHTFDTGTRLTFTRAPFTVNLLRRRDHNFAATLRDKLNWAADRQS